MTPTTAPRPTTVFANVRSLLLVAVITFIATSFFAIARAESPIDAAKDEERDALVLTLGTSRPESVDLPSVSRVNVRDARLEPVLPRVRYPWAFEFINESEILLTQHAGKLLHVDLSSGVSKAIEALPDIAGGTGQMGLLDVALHPDFKSNRRIYLSYAKPYEGSDRYSVLEVVTAVLLGNQLTDTRTLLNYDRYSWAPSNFGGAMTFDDKEYLYVTVGDRGEETGATRRGDRLEGKVLRVTDLGDVPSDNPFVGVEGYDPRVYAVGLRNAQGLVFDSPTGMLVEVEHGPLGGDEVNVIEAGQDYGFPTVSYGGYYADARPFGQGTHAEGTEQPIFYFLPSIAASKVMIYRGSMFPEWNGHIFVTALAGQHVAKLDLDGSVVRSTYAILQEAGGRIRDIKEAPDGSIYILSQTHGLKRLFRPAPPPFSRPRVAPDSSISPPIQREDLSNDPFFVRNADSRSGPHPGKALYVLACGGCHDPGVSAAQDLGDFAAWEPIMRQTPAVTREHVIFGYGDMPPWGFCNSCPIQDVYNAIGYMFEEAQHGRKE